MRTTVKVLRGIFLKSGSGRYIGAWSSNRVIIGVFDSNNVSLLKAIVLKSQRTIGYKYEYRIQDVFLKDEIKWFEAHAD